MAIAIVWRWPPEKIPHLASNVRNIDLQLRKQTPGLFRHRCSVEDPQDSTQNRFLDLPAEKDVGRDVDIVAKRQVLINGLNAEFLGACRRGDMRWLPLDPHLAFVGDHRAGENLDEGRLPGTIVAEQCHRFAGTYTKINVLQCGDAAVELRNATHFHDELAVSRHRRASLDHGDSLREFAGRSHDKKIGTASGRRPEGSLGQAEDVLAIFFHIPKVNQPKPRIDILGKVRGLLLSADDLGENGDRLFAHGPSTL